MRRRLTAPWRARATLASLLLPPLTHLASMERIATWVGRAAGRPERPADVDHMSLAEWVDRVLVALPWPWRRTCLKRGLVLFYLTARAGAPTTLVIGVRRSDSGELLAHAWLTRTGTLYLEPGGDPSAYRQIAAFECPPQ